MFPKIIKVCDLWRGKIVDSPQTARAFWPPTTTSDQSGGGRQIKFVVINEKADMLQQGRDGGEVHTQHREPCRCGKHAEPQGPAALPRSDSDI